MASLFDLKIIKGYVLSPANIYWVRRSGEKTLVAQKADFLNHELIEKLTRSKHKFEVEDLIAAEFIDEIYIPFMSHRKELHIKDKLGWRNQLLMTFRKRLLAGENSQFELDQVMWKIFSRFSTDQSKSFLDKDIDLFKRSMAVASSLTLFAFILGHYHDEFLIQMYNQTFIDLFNVSEKETLISMKENLEYLRTKETLSKNQSVLLLKYYHKKKFIFNERYDGSGTMKVSDAEMTDLEILLVAFNAHFSYRQDPNANILFQLRRGEFVCEPRIVKMILSVLDKSFMPVNEEFSA